MSKQKQQFHCTNCDYRTPKWIGCCPTCNEWGSFSEMAAPAAHTPTRRGPVVEAVPLDSIAPTSHTRMTTGIDEWDRVMGGGIMPGSFIMVTGDPGIGKSTLLLQIAYNLAQNYKVLYFSSEESLEQVRLRAERLDCANGSLLFSDQADLDSVLAITDHHKADMIIIDSIQNCYSPEGKTVPGSIGQLRESAFRLMQFAKKNTVATIATGHITKEGVIAGPKMLEHLVDAVFYLQGDETLNTRILRSVKNRFGAVHEVGFFEMHETGLQQVTNINQQLIKETAASPGSVLTSFIEGSRPLLVELQALTVGAKFGMAQRVVSGVDHKQVVLIAAILEKYLRIKLSEQDIFFKTHGNFRMKESSADLGIALALLSSYYQKPLPEKSLVIGEISLTGRIKPAPRFTIHSGEAEKFGISTIFTARQQGIAKKTCTVKQFGNVYELLELFDIE
jgi:DNA repair protein RadA/Sms